MRHTHLARDLRWVIAAALLALFGTKAAAQTRDSDTLSLDLTKPVPREEQINRLAGMSVGGTTGGVGRIPHPYTLPLAVTLESIAPRQLGPRGRLSVEVILRNTGAAPFYLPASLKHATLLKQGNQGRRTFLFSIILEDVGKRRKLSFGIGSSDGSETAPGSFFPLAPGQAVRVLLAGGLNSVDQQQAMSQWLKDGVKEVIARAEVSEWKYEDKRYFIENGAEPVLSGNSLLLDLAPPD